VIVAAIAIAAGCGQASGGDSVVHPATFDTGGQGSGSTGESGKQGAVHRVAQYDLQQLSVRGTRLTAST